MSAVRADIREAVVATLKAAGTLAGSNVDEHPFNDRRITRSFVVEDLGSKHSDGNLTEVQTEIDIGGNVSRQYRFCVTAEAMGGTKPQRDRDVMCGQAEAALVAAVAAGSLGGARTISPVGYTADDDNSGDQPIRRGMQVFQATYITAAGAPSTTL